MKFSKARFLLEHYHPSIFPIRVVRTELEDDMYGYCSMYTRKDTTKIKIAISKTLSPVAQIDTLIHEWAHAKLAAIPEEFEKHNALWGVYYSQCYITVYPD